MSKRDEAIGRAACKAFASAIGCNPIGWDALSESQKDEWTREGLAAVAEARRLDTCQACEFDKTCLIKQALQQAGAHEPKFGCNRHQPKEA